MLFDQYGNYVVQTMINVSIDVHDDRREGDLTWLTRLSERISRHESRLLKYSSGKKIIEKMKQLSTTDNVICSVSFDQNYLLNLSELRNTLLSELPNIVFGSRLLSQPIF
ncbi:unnamed protein product [Onchocerca flexuosa]|uniref:PUM-HD domain-containing protein n=1 Tax=Onchocerca flexuosa TaxID=387005 RepID=A0A183GY90_9BILA|nr:unnamed protein product [Onchocerca flexuosa]